VCTKQFHKDANYDYVTTTQGTFLVDDKYFIKKRLLPSTAKYGDLPFLLHGREHSKNVSEKSLDTYFWWMYMCISLMSWGLGSTCLYIGWWSDQCLTIGLYMFVLLTSYQVIHVCHTDVLLGYIVRHRGLYKYMSYWTLWDSSADSSLFTLSPRYLTTCACLSCFCWSFCFNFFFTLAFLSFFLDTSAACDRKRKRQLVWRETETLLTIS